MKRWYDRILRNITELGPKLFLIDPHQLLKDMNFYNALSESYKLHEYYREGDLYQFFYNNKDTNIIVYSITPLQISFIKNNFKIIEIRINDVFEELDETLIQQIDITYFQNIYDHYCELQKQGRQINTQDLLLRSIWHIEPGELYSKTANLRIALSYIIDEKDIPERIIKDASERLSVDIKEFQQDTNKFITFIQNINKDYLNDIKSGRFPRYDLKDDMIQLQMIKSIIKYDIDVDNIYQKYPIQIQEHSKNQIIQRIQQLKTLYQKEMEGIKERPFDFNEIDTFFRLATHFFELLYLIQSNDLNIQEYLDLDQNYESFDKIIRENLINNTTNKYQALFYLPEKQSPITVDKILKYIKQNYSKDPIALIIMDGMSYDEWFILKKQLTDFNIIEKQSFAIVPTITSFSRISILTGKTPHEFMDANLNANEKNACIESLIKQGYDKNNILYGLINLKNNTINTISETKPFHHLQKYDFLALICNLFDDLSHETVITKKNKSSLYNKITYELKNSSFIAFLKQLKTYGYTIILTSDHGNIFSIGNDIIPNKNLVITSRSKRCIIYDKKQLAETLVQKYPNDTFSYTYQFIPSNLHLVLPLKNKSFTAKHNHLITHGGISPEELIVPVVILT